MFIIKILFNFNEHLNICSKFIKFHNFKSSVETNINLLIIIQLKFIKFHKIISLLNSNFKSQVIKGNVLKITF